MSTSPQVQSLEVSTPMAILHQETLRTIVAARVSAERRTLTVISGASAGQVFALSSATHILGRGESADLRVPDTDVSRAHVRIFRTEEGETGAQDLGSTNGTFVGGERITRVMLSPGDRIQCGPNLVLRYGLSDDLEEDLHRRMYESSSRDVLTLAANRRYLVDRLLAEVAHARRHSQPLSLVKIDLDRFQAINEAHGYVVGDIVLRALAARLGRIIRVEDVFARWEGDEFAILARSSDRADAGQFAARVRAAISEIEIPSGGTPIHITASLGVASLSELRSDAKPGELVAIADRRLGAAKAAGRDRVVTEG